MDARMRARRASARAFNSSACARARATATDCSTYPVRSGGNAPGCERMMDSAAASAVPGCSRSLSRWVRCQTLMLGSICRRKRMASGCSAGLSAARRQRRSSASWATRMLPSALTSSRASIMRSISSRAAKSLASAWRSGVPIVSLPASSMPSTSSRSSASSRSCAGGDTAANTSSACAAIAPSRPPIAS